jgi:hypothetical protein
MNPTNRNAFRAAAFFMPGAGLLQIFGLIRHVERLPEDWIGIGIYIVSIIAFAIASLAFYSKARET